MGDDILPQYKPSSLSVLEHTTTIIYGVWQSENPPIRKQFGTVTDKAPKIHQSENSFDSSEPIGIQYGESGTVTREIL